MNEKAAFRKRMRAIRRQMSDTERTEQSLRACKRAFLLPEVQQARVIMAYAPMQEELNVWPLIHALTQADKQIVLPVVEKKGMYARRLTKQEHLHAGAYGILEPMSDETVDPSEIEVVFVPGVAFSRTGQRMGMGAGYYDRFLPQTKAFAIGMCLADLLCVSLPTDAFDRPMDAVCTPTDVFYRVDGKRRICDTKA